MNDHQVQPTRPDWRTWLLLGGRGSGKTFAGAVWIDTMARKSLVNLALVGPALHDVREVMVEGPSGIKALADPGDRPRWEAGRRRLVWPDTGSAAYAFSAEDPDSLRGPQFHGAWGDEFCAWRKPGDVLAMLRLGLRLGEDPRLMVTTTPKPMKALRTLMDEPGTVTTHAATQANATNLSKGFLSGLKAMYGDTRLEAQEIEGRVVSNDACLWTQGLLDRCRGYAPTHFDKVVVGLDPPVTSGGDACGIVVVGKVGDTAYVLADETVRGLRPKAWAEKVARAVAVHEADWVIAETNQGGEMVEDLLRVARCGARVKSVFASTSKRARAEPVALLYDKGRVIHCGHFPRLEDEMTQLGFEQGADSPDRLDALVWAVSHLLLGRRGGPSIRVL